MRSRSRMLLTLGAGLLVLGGCAGATGTAGPTTSPTGRVYEPGTQPSQTRQSQAATLFIAQQNYEQALAQAQEGLEADSANPVHYFLAGQAYAGLGDYERANEMFERAEEIYPAYELDIEPEREAAWGVAFNRGVEAYNEGDIEEASEWWDRANRIYGIRPEAYMNLAVIHTQERDYDRAIEAYRGGLTALDREPATRRFEEEELAERAETRATMRRNLAELLGFTERYGEAEELIREQLEERPDDPELLSNLALSLSRQGREQEAQEIYGRLLAQPDLSADDLFNLGVALFNSENFEQSEEAFRRVTEMQPQSRDAWYNYANALYAREAYEDLVPVAERLVELDPLNQNSALILAQAYRQTQQSQRALEQLQRNESQPVHVDELQMRPREGETRITGTVVGNQAQQGTPVQLRFTFYGERGELGRETVTVNAPADEERANFEVVLQSEEPAVAYRYELVR